MRMRGIKRGQKIELFDAIDIPDGTEIELEIRLPEFWDNRPLTSFIGSAKGGFISSEEVDQFIRQERDSWDD